MARTFRRKQEWHEYRWVRRDWKADLPRGAWIDLDPHSNAGRKAIARFHSDKVATMLGAAPRWYRKVALATRRRLPLDDHADIRGRPSGFRAAPTPFSGHHGMPADGHLRRKTTINPLSDRAFGVL